MNFINDFDYIETHKSGFDYPSEATTESTNNTESSSKWLDDYGWV